jgi:hypothetical protein
MMTKKTKAGKSGAKEANPTIAPVIFCSSAAEAVADTHDYYRLFRQRAAERPLQARFFSRFGSSIDKREVWSKQGEIRSQTLMSMTEAFISVLESEPRIDEHKKLSIVQIVWSIRQCEMDDAIGAITASRDDHKSRIAERAREGKKLAEKENLIRRLSDDFLNSHPDVSNSRIADGILETLNLELRKLGVPVVKTRDALRKLIGRHHSDETSKGDRAQRGV